MSSSDPPHAAIGQALIFSGSTTVTVPSLVALGPYLRSFTLELWLRTSHVHHCTLLCARAGGALLSLDLSPPLPNAPALPGDARAALRLTLQDAGQRRLEGHVRARLLDDAWHHILWAVPDAPAAATHVHIDGVPCPVSLTAAAGPEEWPEFPDGLLIGAAPSPEFKAICNRHFVGALCDLRLWHGARAVAHWPLRQQTGAAAEDAAEGAHPGALRHGRWDVAGLPPTACYFNGAGAHVDLGPVGDFGAYLRRCALELWVKTGPGGGDGPRCLFDALDANAGGLRAVVDGAALALTVRDAAGRELGARAACDVRDGEWHHVLWRVVDAAEAALVLAVDGRRRPLTSPGGLPACLPREFAPWAHRARLGGCGAAGPGPAPFEGFIADVRLWVGDRALAAHWPLGDGPGAVALRDLSAGGGAARARDVSWRFTPRPGAALRFAGSVAAAAHVTGLSLGRFALSLWMKSQGAAPAPPAAAAPRLTGHWKLQGDCQDASGGGRCGTAHGPVRWVPGAQSPVLQLEGGACVPLCASDALLKGDVAFSLAAWFRATAPAPEGGAAWLLTLAASLREAHHVPKAALGLSAAGGGCVQVAWTGERGREALHLRHPVQYWDGGWHHVACAYDRASRLMTLYFDGREVAHAAAGVVRPAHSALAVVGAAAAPGANAPHTPPGPFEGGLADVRVYEGCLGREEVAALSAHADPQQRTQALLRLEGEGGAHAAVVLECNADGRYERDCALFRVSDGGGRAVSVAAHAALCDGRWHHVEWAVQADASPPLQVLVGVRDVAAGGLCGGGEGGVGTRPHTHRGLRHTTGSRGVAVLHGGYVYQRVHLHLRVGHLHPAVPPWAPPRGP